MYDKESIANKLGVDHTNIREWNNRHTVPSARSAFVIPEHYVERLSLIRQSGDVYEVLTNLSIPIDKPYSRHSKRFIDNILDWEIMYDLNDRNKYLARVINKTYPRLGSIIMKHDGIIVTPSNLNAKLNSEEESMLELLLIYSKIPSEDEISEDLQMLHGIRATKAQEYIDAGILIHEKLLHVNGVDLIDFKCNINHASGILGLFPEKLNVEVVGSFGRGFTTGHDVDLLVHTKNSCEVIKILDRIALKMLNKGSRWTIYSLDLRVQVDLGTYDDTNYIASKMHYLGPKSKNIKMRGMAKNKGMVLSNKGLFRKGEMIKLKTPMDLYDAIGFDEEQRTAFNNVHALD